MNFSNFSNSLYVDFRVLEFSDHKHVWLGWSAKMDLAKAVVRNGFEPFLDIWSDRVGGPPDRGEILWLDGGFANFQGLIWCSLLGFFD